MKTDRTCWKGKDTPPMMAEAAIGFSDRKVTLTCPTPSALIGWRKSSRESWKLYTGPFEATTEDSLYVNTHQIGYEAKQMSIILL